MVESSPGPSELGVFIHDNVSLLLLGVDAGEIGVAVLVWLSFSRTLTHNFKCELLCLTCSFIISGAVTG